VLLAAGAISFVLSLWLKPVLGRFAVAKPNARSSHKTPTPQGGGIAVIAATIVVFATIVIFSPTLINESWRLAVVFVSVVGLAVIGITDDIRPIAALPRLLLQAIAVVAVVASLPDDLRVLAVLPWWLERALLFVAMLWFVNLVNFMDGIDWMTVAEISRRNALRADYIGTVIGTQWCLRTRTLTGRYCGADSVLHIPFAMRRTAISC